MRIFGNNPEALVEGTSANGGVRGIAFRVESGCIVEIDRHFYLLLLVEFVNFDRVVVFRISREQAADLIRRGVRNCPILPATEVKENAQLLGVFTVEDDAFLVFEVECADKLVLVRIPRIGVEHNEL